MKTVNIWDILNNKLEEVNCRPYIAELPVEWAISSKIEGQMEWFSDHIVENVRGNVL